MCPSAGRVNRLQPRILESGLHLTRIAVHNTYGAQRRSPSESSRTARSFGKSISHRPTFSLNHFIWSLSEFLPRFFFRCSVINSGRSRFEVMFLSFSFTEFRNITACSTQWEQLSWWKVSSVAATTFALPTLTINLVNW